jgi:hypothetical protein
VESIGREQDLMVEVKGILPRSGVASICLGFLCLHTFYTYIREMSSCFWEWTDGFCSTAVISKTDEEASLARCTYTNV